MNDWFTTGNPPISSQFQLVVDGVEIGMFLELSGLEMSIDVATYEEGGQNGFVHKFPGRISWPNLVFKRGITNSDALFNWVNESSGETFASNGNKLTRRTGAVSVLDYSGNPLRSWTLISPFPVKWTGPRLSSRESNVLDEEIEIAHQGFKSKTFKPS